jgi:hypothetical protein
MRHGQLDQEFLEFCEDFANYYRGREDPEITYWLYRLGRILGRLQGRELFPSVAFAHPENPSDRIGRDG